MNRKRTAGTRLFAASAVIALPMTVALLFLMTHLILPGEQDRIVTRTIQNIEFQRAVLPPDPASIQVFELPAPIEPRLTAEGSSQPQNRDSLSDESYIEEGPAHIID